LIQFLKRDDKVDSFLVLLSDYYDVFVLVAYCGEGPYSFDN